MDELNQTKPTSRKPLPDSSLNRPEVLSPSPDAGLLSFKPAVSPSQIDIKPPPDHTAPHLIQFAHPVLQWVLYFGKRFLEVPPIYKVVFYLVLVGLCSFLSDVLNPLRSFYFFRKESFLNQWFVKLGWGWTFFLLLVFFVLAGVLENDGRIHKIARNIFRLLVGTAMWFVVTTSFVGIARRTSYCTSNDFATRKACEEGGSTWLSFDISGHAFLLIYCSLMIQEESRGFFKWERADRIEGEVEGDFDRKIKPVILVLMRILAVGLALLAMLWDGMLIITLTYYHDVAQRLLGVLLGIGGWFVTYKLWYPRAWPGLPKDVSPLTARK